MGNRIQSEEVVETDCPKVSTQNIRYDDVTTGIRYKSSDYN